MMSEDELLRQACIYAEMWMEIAADDTETHEEHQANLAKARQFREYRISRWGKTSRDRAREVTDNTTLVSPYEVAGRGKPAFSVNVPTDAQITDAVNSR